MGWAWDPLSAAWLSAIVSARELLAPVSVVLSALLSAAWWSGAASVHVMVLRSAVTPSAHVFEVASALALMVLGSVQMLLGLMLILLSANPLVLTLVLRSG